MFYTLPDLLMAITLLVNAAAILNFKFLAKKDVSNDDSLKARIFNFFHVLRYLRVVILGWNVAVVFILALIIVIF